MSTLTQVTWSASIPPTGLLLPRPHRNLLPDFIHNQPSGHVWLTDFLKTGVLTTPAVGGRASLCLALRYAEAGVTTFWESTRQSTLPCSFLAACKNMWTRGGFWVAEGRSTRRCSLAVCGSSRCMRFTATVSLTRVPFCASSRGPGTSPAGSNLLDVGYHVLLLGPTCSFLRPTCSLWCFDRDEADHANDP